MARKLVFEQKKAHFPISRSDVIKQLFFVFTHVHNPKVVFFFGESISIVLSHSLCFCTLGLSALLAVLLPTLSSFFCMELNY